MSEEKPSTLKEALSRVMSIYECREFTINGKLKKDGQMAWAFIVFKRKRDNKVKVGLVRYNPKTFYVHSVTPLPDEVNEFSNQLHEIFKVKEEIEEEERIKKAEKRAMKILEKLSPEEREIFKKILIKEIKSKRKKK